MKLLKLLYIADRESIREEGAPITGDNAIAMQHGPVLSGVYSIISDCKISLGPKSWNRFFSVDGYDLVMHEHPGNDEMCPYHTEKLRDVFERYKHLDPFALNDVTHKFAEWVNNRHGGCSCAIQLEDIVRAVGREDDLDYILQERSEAIKADKFFRELELL